MAILRRNYPYDYKEGQGNGRIVMRRRGQVNCPYTHGILKRSQFNIEGAFPQSLGIPLRYMLPKVELADDKIPPGEFCVEDRYGGRECVTVTKEAAFYSISDWAWNDDPPEPKEEKVDINVEPGAEKWKICDLTYHSSSGLTLPELYYDSSSLLKIETEYQRSDYVMATVLDLKGKFDLTAYMTLDKLYGPVFKQYTLADTGEGGALEHYPNDNTNGYVADSAFITKGLWVGLVECRYDCPISFYSKGPFVSLHYDANGTPIPSSLVYGEGGEQGQAVFGVRASDSETVVVAGGSRHRLHCQSDLNMGYRYITGMFRQPRAWEEALARNVGVSIVATENC